MFFLAEHDRESLARALQEMGFAASHARTVLRAFHRDAAVADWTRTPLPVRLRQLLDTGPLLSTSIERRALSEDGTAKLLVRLGDGQHVEAVLMPDHRPDRAAGCVSTQVGCAMGCDFCATAQGGWRRNLTAGEIVEQFLHLRREAQAAGRRLHTVVFMGMGEPLQNFDATVAAARRITANELGALGAGQLTVSTVGLVPAIDRLAESGLNVGLALSLHAPDDETRRRLLPAGRTHSIHDILASADRYQQTTGRPVSIQYCLLAGVNDTREHARRLAALLAGRRMHVNLLSYNPTGPGLGGFLYRRSDDESTAAFLAILQEARIATHWRRPRGRDVDAACGQLRATHRRRDRAARLERNTPADSPPESWQPPTSR